jgi:hypothetical protein
MMNFCCDALDWVNTSARGSGRTSGSHRDRLRHLIIDCRDTLRAPIADMSDLTVLWHCQNLRSVTIYSQSALGHAFDQRLPVTKLYADPGYLWKFVHTEDAKEEVISYVKGLWQLYRHRKMYYGDMANLGFNDSTCITISIELGWFEVVYERRGANAVADDKTVIGKILVSRLSLTSM